MIMGANFGHDVINADQGGSGQQDVLRFTNVKSTDVTASRSGIDRQPGMWPAAKAAIGRTSMMGCRDLPG